MKNSIKRVQSESSLSALSSVRILREAKKIFQYILMAVAVVTTASCSNELDEALQPAGNGALQFVVGDFPTFVEGTQTRVIGTPDEGKTAWEKDDQIIITLTSQKYGEQAAALTYNGSSWSTEASLSYLENETPTVSVIYAPCYEVTEEGVMQLRSGMLLGMTEYLFGNYEMENGIMTITFEGGGRTYSRLRIAGLENQSLTVTTKGFTPAGATSETTEAYTLTTDDKGNAYLYGTFAKGATVSVSDGAVTLVDKYTFTTTTIDKMSYALDATPYLTFSAPAEQTLTLVKNFDPPSVDFQYSVNGAEWGSATAGRAITFGGEAGDLRLRAKSTGLCHIPPGGGYYQISFGNETPVTCTGDIRTLLDWENYTTANTANAGFYSLFYECKQLLTAPTLPATTLAEYCYSEMFYGCTSLTVAPALPATTLATDCYSSMFRGCTSLTVAPTLPATTLATDCYSNMFRNCTSLSSITMLATDISAKGCLSSWVSRVSSSGTFYKNSEATWNITGTDGIPEGWTVVTK